VCFPQAFSVAYLHLHFSFLYGDHLLRDRQLPGLHPSAAWMKRNLFSKSQFTLACGIINPNHGHRFSTHVGSGHTVPMMANVDTVALTGVS